MDLSLEGIWEIESGILPWSCAYFAWVRLCYGLVLVVCRNFQGHSIGEMWNTEGFGRSWKVFGR